MRLQIFFKFITFLATLIHSMTNLNLFSVLLQFIDTNIFRVLRQDRERRIIASAVSPQLSLWFLQRTPSLQSWNSSSTWTTPTFTMSSSRISSPLKSASSKKVRLTRLAALQWSASSERKVLFWVADPDPILILDIGPWIGQKQISDHTVLRNLKSLM